MSNPNKSLREKLRNIVTRNGKTGRIPELLEAELDRLEALILSKQKEVETELLYNLDEIDNKPWKVFGQLAKIQPEYSETYDRYYEFYAHGGSRDVMKLIEKFEEEQLAPTGINNEVDHSGIIDKRDEYLIRRDF